MRIFLLGFSLLGSAVIFGADLCSPPAEFPGFERPLPPDWREIQSVIEARLRQTPDDWTLNRLLVDSSVYQRKPVRDRMAELALSQPDNLDYQYLYARSLVGSNTKEALRLYRKILDKDPDYQWIHLSQLEIFRSDAFRNRGELTKSFSTLVRVCPESFAPFRYLNDLADDDLAAKGAAKLRVMLSDAKSPRDLSLYKTLWAVAFRLPKSEGQDPKQRVALDLERLKPLYKEEPVRATLREGASLVGDRDLLEKTRPEPNRSQEVGRLSNAWLKSHPRPKEADSDATKRTYGEALFKEAQQWCKGAPDSVVGAMDKLRALIWMKAPEAEIGKAGDAVVAIERKNEFSTGSWIPEVAREYVAAGVLHDRVPAIIAEATERFADPEVVIEIDLSPSTEMTSNNRTLVVGNYVDAMAILAKCYEKRGDLTRARLAVVQAEDFLRSHPMATDEKGVNVRFYRITANSNLWQAKGELAEAEGKTLDALTCYHRARSFSDWPRPDLDEKARKLWNQLGGSEEGWHEWTGASAETAKTGPVKINRDEFSAVKRKLPTMSLRDTEGKVWTLDQFAGKTTIAVVWATWCEPCRAELPHFAKLFERLRGREGVVALSFNTDDNFAHAESYSKSAGYKFPVLSAKQYAEDLMPLMSIPRTWIIRNGVIAEEVSGFSGDGDKWVEEMLAKVR